MDKIKGKPDDVKDYIISLLQSNSLLFISLGRNQPPEIKKAMDEYIATHGKLDFTHEQLDAIVLQIINGNCYDKILSDIVSEEALSDYLTNKPETNEQDTLILDNVLGLLSGKTIQDLQLSQFVLAELLMRSSNIELTQALGCYKLIDDNYLRALITLSKQTNYSNLSLYWKQEYSTRISDMDSLDTDEEKRDYINSFDFQTNQEDSDYYFLNRAYYNLMKKHLLSKISDHDCKMEVIRSMTPTISPELQDYVKVAQEMLREFLTSRGPLTPEKEENLQLVFNSFSVQAQDSSFFAKQQAIYGDESTVHIGLCDYNYQTISILQSELPNIETTLLILLHEYTHALSNRNFNESIDTFGGDFEEGIADTVAELAFNGYMNRHNSIAINGQQYIYRNYVTSNSTYFEQDAEVKAILYAMESEGTDIDALIEVCIGNKDLFLDMALGEKEANNARKKFNDKAMNLKYYPDQICQILGSKIHKRNRQKTHRHSPYLYGHSAIDLLTDILLGNGGPTLHDWSDEPDPLPRSAKTRSSYSLREIEEAINRHNKRR